MASTVTVRCAAISMPRVGYSRREEASGRVVLGIAGLGLGVTHCGRNDDEIGRRRLSATTNSVQQMPQHPTRRR